MKKLQDYLNARDISEMLPGDFTKLLKECSAEEFAQAIVLVPKKFVGDIALALPDRYFKQIVARLNIEELSLAVRELESDDQVDFLHELGDFDESLALELFKSLSEEDKEEIIKLQTYKESEAGAHMQLELFTAFEDERVQDVVTRFAAMRAANEVENVQKLFITDEKKVLKYSVGLDDLLIFDFNKTLMENIVARSERFEPLSAQDSDDIKDVVRTFEVYDIGVLAVLNRHGVLLGRITADDIYDIINEHATEQMYRLAGVNDAAEEDEEILPAGKKRALWLSFNLVTAIAASLVIGLFSETLESMVALAILMPIVASMGGNAGTQSLTVVVRQLALGDISAKDAARIVRKEVIIALLNGFLFAIIVGVIASLWFDKGMLGIVIAMSMIINLFAAGFFGAAVPLLLKKMQIDPAIGSTVILTTVTDLVGFFSFLGLATYILF